jgi:pilus assembly protein CpaB
MDRRFLTVLGVSLVFALVVSSVFYQMSARAGGGSGPKKEDTEFKELVVAAKPIQVGVNVKPDDIKVVKMAADSFPKGAFSKPEEVIDRPVISNILLDEPVLEGRLAARGSGSGLAPIIPVGMRAVSVRVNEVVGLAGFVLPGMHVDVLVTGRPPTDTASTMTTTVLQDITVLTAGQSLQSDPNGQPINAPVVTLLVTPEQAETLTLAGTETRIQLVLRNAADKIITSTGGRQLNELYENNRLTRKKTPAVSEISGEARPRPRPRPAVAQAALPAPVPVAVAPLPPPVPDQIIMIRGTQRSVEVVSPARITGNN